MAVFECLVAAGGEPVSRSDLLDAVWPGAEVSEGVLTQCIAELRRALGDSAREPRVIETIPRLGFRLVLPAEPHEDVVPPGGSFSDHKRPGRRGRWRGLRFLGLGFLAVTLVVGVLLSISSTRLWLTEKGVTLFMKTAATLSPHRLQRKPGVAVLPFVNFSGDPENEYFSDGMSVEIINRLARYNRLPVIARSSSFEFKDRQQDVREIGRQLGVTHVLEGSVRRSGQDIRLTVQLIDSTKGTHVWSGIYQRELSDVFQIQEEIATEIVDQIYLAFGQSVGPRPHDRPANEFMEIHPPANLEAYDLFLEGVDLLTSNRPALLEQAPAVFDRAIALDPGYADAWAGKGIALLALPASGSGTSVIPASVYPDAIASFRRALEIEPRHAFATGWLGVALMLNDFKWEQGLRLMEQSLAWNPNDATLLSVYGFYLDTLQLEGAEDVLERAYRLDPHNIETIVNRAINLQRQGRLMDAAALVETTLFEDREGYTPNYFSALFNIRIGRLDAAEAQIRRVRQVAKPIDFNLDALQWMIDSRRGTAMLPRAEILERMKTERLNGIVIWEGWRDPELIDMYGLDEESIVAVFELAIEQRHPALRTAMFRPKPLLMPEADWRRMKEITGVTRFQESLRE
jgi:TolB-like protein/Tfp pilus assembly protein PilF